MVEEKPQKVFKATPILMTPILASLLISVSCAFLVLQSQVVLSPATVFPESGYGPLLNAAVFVLASSIGATTILFLMRRNVYRVIRLFMAIAFSVLIFLLVVFYVELAFVIADIRISFAVSLLLASLATVFGLWGIFLRKDWLYDGVILVVGGAAGTLLGAAIPTISAVSILLLLAMYDVVSVFRGPIGKLAALGLENLPGASFSFKGITVGLGDLTFYSMLVSHVFLNFGLAVCLAAIVGVLAGSFLSFKMVEKKDLFPGLPFSILFGLLASFIVLRF